RLSMSSNLLAHHVGVLESAGIVRRSRSDGDRRRTYLQLIPDALTQIASPATWNAPRVVFVCSLNSARSQLATALWRRHSAVPATSAGTRPAKQVHSGAIAAAQRHDLPLHAAT